MGKFRKSDRFKDLRERAERLLADSYNPKDVHQENLAKIFHELSVYQTELEIQNEELRRVQIELEDSRNKYLDLYDFSPISYLTIDERTFIIEVNLTCSTFLGVDREFLLNNSFQIFVHPDYRDKFRTHLQHVFTQGISQSEELLITCKSGAERWVYLESIPLKNPEGVTSCIRSALCDITENKKAQEQLRESEALLRAVLDSTSDPVYVKDREGRIIMANDALSRVVGKPLEEIIGRTDSEYYDNNVVGQMLREHDLKVMKSGICVDMEEIVPTPNGNHIFLSNKAPYRNVAGEVIGVIGISRDITQLKHIEDELKQSRLQLESELADTKLLQGISSEFLHKDNIQTLYEKIIEAAVLIMRSEFASMQILYPEHGNGGKLRLIAYRGFTPEAAKFWEWVGFDSGGSTCGKALRTGSRVIVEDVEKCDFMQGTDDLAMFLQTGIHACQTTPLYSRNGKIVGMISTHWLNPHKPSERDLSMWDILVRQAADLIERALAEEELNEHRQDLEKLVKEGTDELNTKNLQLEKEAAERKRIEDILRERESHFRLLAENSSDIIFTMDVNLQFTYISPSITRIRGFSVDEAMSQTLAEALAPASLEAAMKVYREELEIEDGETKDHYRTHILELEETCKDGSTVWTETTFSALLDQNNKLIGIQGITRDISERKKIEAEKKKIENQFIQFQKMEALGRFAGGIAHDLNNLLYPVIINTESLLEEARLQDDNNMYEMLKQVLNAAYQQKDLVSQILSFSRQKEQEVRHSPIRVASLIKETLNFIKSSLSRAINIKRNIDDSYDMIMGDSTQIQQIIMNLCKNASDALEPQGGTIEVSLSNTYMEPVNSHDDFKPGQYLQLAIRDNGCGIPDKIMDRIFEPFFTTKDEGKGSGMGLALVHGIVKNHGGMITVESKPGEGTCFTVYLPIADRINGDQSVSTVKPLSQKEDSNI